MKKFINNVLIYTCAILLLVSVWTPLAIAETQTPMASGTLKNAERYIKNGKLMITPHAQGKKFSYVLKKIKKKMRNGEVIEDIRISTPFKIRFSGTNSEPTMQITYEHTTIDKAFHKTQTIPKTLLELMSSTTAALGPVELMLSERGQIKHVANLPKIRENMTASFEKMIKAIDETGASQKDRKVFRGSLNIVKSASDDKLTALIEASLVEYLRIYYEDYPLNKDQAVEIPLNLGVGTIPLQTTYQINSDQGGGNAIIRITQRADKDSVKVNVTTEIKTNLALGVISILKEERSMVGDNGAKFIQITTLEPQ